MNSLASRTFPGFKAIALLTMAAASAALFVPKFGHANDAMAQTVTAVSATVPVRATATVPVEPQSLTPASTNYHDGINVAAIAVAAYDH